LFAINGLIYQAELGIELLNAGYPINAKSIYYIAHESLPMFQAPAAAAISGARLIKMLVRTGSQVAVDLALEYLKDHKEYSNDIYLEILAITQKEPDLNHLKFEQTLHADTIFTVGNLVKQGA